MPRKTLRQQVNSQSQSGSATFGPGTPFFSGLSPAGSHRGASNPHTERTLATAEALKKELRNTVKARKKSNAQGQGQITQADLWAALVLQVPIAADLAFGQNPIRSR